MSHPRPPYPAGFRQQMIELVRAGKPASQLAKEFGCCAKTIMNWVAQAAIAQDQPPASQGRLSGAEREELSRLRRQVRQLQMERDILAKATAWFAAKGEKTFTVSSSS
jgi:transposase